MRKQDIDFGQLYHIENKISNQEHFEKNKKKFSNQCKKIHDAFLRGERLTTTKALLKYKIGHLPRRVKDLRDIWNIPVQSVRVKGNYNEYFLNIKFE